MDKIELAGDFFFIKIVCQICNRLIKGHPLAAEIQYAECEACKRDAEKEKEYTKQCAEYLGWKYDEVKGDSGLMQRLVDGQWNEDEFLVVQPGQKISEDITNKGIIKSE